jgi:hypothetical protein
MNQRRRSWKRRKDKKGEEVKKLAFDEWVSFLCVVADKRVQDAEIHEPRYISCFAAFSPSDSCAAQMSPGLLASAGTNRRPST